MMLDYVCPSCGGGVNVACKREARVVEIDGKKYAELWVFPESPMDVQKLQMIVPDPLQDKPDHPGKILTLVAQWDSLPIPGNPQGLHRRAVRFLLDVPKAIKETVPANEVAAVKSESDEYTYLSKPQLLEEAAKAGIEHEPDWTRSQLQVALRTKKKALAET